MEETSETVAEKCDADVTTAEPSFNNVMDTYHNALDEILGDPFLSDLPQNVTLNEVKSLIALEHGQAMTIKVRRADGNVYSVIVDQNATVSDFKKAIRRHVQLKQEREGGATYISWRHVWKSYWLVFQCEKMKDSEKLLKDYGIRNRDEVIFLKRLREK